MDFVIRLQASKNQGASIGETAKRNEKLQTSFQSMKGRLYGSKCTHLSLYMNHNCKNAASRADGKFFQDLSQLSSNLAVYFHCTIH